MYSMKNKKENGLKHRVALVFFFLSPLLMIFSVYNTLNSYASSSPPDKPQPVALQWQKTPQPDLNLAAEATPIPLDGQGTAAHFIYLPIIHKSRILAPGYDLLTAFGPIINPRQPDQVIGVVPAQDTPQVPPSPTPTQPPPTPGGSPTPNATLGTPTWTPTSKPTFTPTIMPTATAELVPNGDLESKRDLWKQYSYLGYDDKSEFFPDGLFFDSDGIPEAPPQAFDGDWYAWLGGASGEIAYIERQLTVPNPANGAYRRYWLAHAIVRQSYDIACADTVYSYLGSPQKEEFLSGHLTFARPDTLEKYGVDLGGMLVCVNKPGQSGCGDSAVQDVTVGGQIKKAVFVSYYELCQIANGTSWYAFLFPISNNTDYPSLLFPSERFPNVTFSDGSTDLAGKTITLQIKVITDPDFPDEKSASSVLVDNVMWVGGPPLPTPTPTPVGASAVQSQAVAPTATATPALVATPSLPPPDADLDGAYFTPLQPDPDLSTNSMADDAYLKKNP